MRTATYVRGNCFGWTSAETAVATAAKFRGYCRVAVAMIAGGRRNCHSSFRGNCRGNDRGLPSVAMIGTTDFATDRTVARAMVTTVVVTVEVP